MHAGKTLRKIVEDSPVGFTEISEQLSMNRGTLYNWFKTPNLPFEKANQVFKKIGYEMSQEEFEAMSVAEDPATYFSSSQQKHDLNFKDQYLKLLEKHTYLLGELMDIKDELAQLKKGKAGDDRAKNEPDNA